MGEGVECNVKIFLAYGMRDAQSGIESLERDEAQNALHATIENSGLGVKFIMRRKAFIMCNILRYTENYTKSPVLR